MELPPKSNKLCTQNPQPTMDNNTNNSPDRISNLPDDLLYQILQLLPTKQAVDTTVLSKRWNNLWTSALSSLDLTDTFLVHQETPNRKPKKTLFINFVDNVLRLVDLPCITSFSLYCFYSYGSSRVCSWLQKGCTPNVKELNISVAFDQEPIRLPPIVFTSTSLVVLKLKANVKFDIPSNGVCFPSLKVLNVHVYNQGDVVLTRNLYSRCPVLEDLVLEGEMLYAERRVLFTVVSKSLKRLRINFTLAQKFGFNNYCFIIRADNLESIDVNDDFLAEYFVIGNMLVLDKANICVGHPSMNYVLSDYQANRAFRLVGGLLQVKSLSLSGCTTGALSFVLDVIYVRDDEDDSDDSNDESEDDGNMEDDEDALEKIRQTRSLPTFICLTHLEFGFLPCSSWTSLLHIVEQSPNLESLVLKKEQYPGNVTYSPNFSWKPQESVPKCLLHHLKEIKIEGFDGQEPEMILVKFLLENARVLQKMTINSQPLSSYKVTVLREKVLAFPRGSKACQVELF